jgi:hypothetical protein
MPVRLDAHQAHRALGYPAAMRLRLRLSRQGPLLHRRELVAIGVPALLAGIAALAFGPLVRAEVSAEASRRHLHVQVGSVRPAWFGVRLLDVGVHLDGVDSIRVHLDEARIAWTFGLHIERVDVKGGQVTLRGTSERIRDDLKGWRGERASGQGGRVVPLAVEAFDVEWMGAEGHEPRADLRAVDAAHDATGLRIHVGQGHIRLGRGDFALENASAEVGPKGMLVRARASSVVAQWAPRPEPRSSAVVEPPSSAPPMQVARATFGRLRAASSAADPGAPLLPLPDVRALRAKAAAVASLLADRIPDGAGITVGALTWKLAEDPGRVALTIGPGPLTLTRTGAQLELRFSSDARASSTALSLRALLPTDDGDVALTLEGGPVSLAMLGVREGAAGLVDVDHATVTGRARVVLAGDGSAITFDAEGGTRGLAMHEPKLAPDVVRGIDLSLRARGALAAGGQVRLDDLAATLGALHLEGSGALEQQPDHVSASFHFDLPQASCQALLDSVPTALLPALQGTRMEGTFGASGRFAFDTRDLDDLELVYDIQDRCSMAEVPPELAPDRFKAPFEHRVYLPDGTTEERTTGPGSDDWTPLDEISPYMPVAVMTTEDGAFPRHHGFNKAAIRASIIANLKARRFVRGASTITMQLAKNLFLTRDKNLARKLEEVVLTDYLEQTFSKDELMELYLNVIEFGPAVYGITEAAEYYFGRTPAELDLAESLFLSSVLPSPRRYGAMRSRDRLPDGWMRLLHTYMEIAHKRGLITDAELAEGEAETVAFWHGGERPPPRPAVQARMRLEGSDDVDVPPVPFDAPADSPDAP